jgi:hypothetical protein
LQVFPIIISRLDGAGCYRQPLVVYIESEIRTLFKPLR